MITGDEKQKFIGGINFDELRGQRIQVYNTIEIDLSIARSNQEHVFTGNYIYAMEATDVDASVNIRFNELFRANINLVKGRGVRCPFYRFYLSNTAQAGKTLILAIGIEAADFEIFDMGKALGITGTVSVAEQNLANGWATEGYQAVVAVNTVMADTGPLDAGIYDFTIFVANHYQVEPADLPVQHRNAANDTTLKDQALASSDSIMWSTFSWKGYSIAVNERVRVFAITNTTLMQVSIFWVRRQ